MVPALIPFLRHIALRSAFWFAGVRRSSHLPFVSFGPTDFRYVASSRPGMCGCLHVDFHNIHLFGSGGNGYDADPLSGYNPPGTTSPIRANSRRSMSGGPLT